MTFRGAPGRDDMGAQALTQFGVEALVAGAARPRPGALAIREEHGDTAAQLSFADLYQRAGAGAARLRALGLLPGERILICAPPGAQNIVALTSALAAGLDPVLAPAPLPETRDNVALAARALDAAALLAPAQWGARDLSGPIRDIAAEAPSIRRIGALYGALPGAQDFTAAALDARLSPRPRLADGWETRGVIGALDASGHIAFATQGALIGAALDLVRATRNAGAAPIVSLCAANSLAHLVAGPLAALLSGAAFHVLTPFDAGRLRETLDACRDARIVAPGALLDDLARAGLLRHEALRGVVALTDGAAATAETDAACPIIEMSFRGGVARIVLRPAAAIFLDSQV